MCLHADRSDAISDRTEMSVGDSPLLERVEGEVLPPPQLRGPAALWFPPAPPAAPHPPRAHAEPVARDPGVNLGGERGGRRAGHQA